MDLFIFLHTSVSSFFVCTSDVLEYNEFSIIVTCFFLHYRVYCYSIVFQNVEQKQVGIIIKINVQQKVALNARTENRAP